MNDLLLLKRKDDKILLIKRNGYPSEYEFRGMVFKKTRKKRKFNEGTALVYEEVVKDNEPEQPSKD